MNNKMSIIIPTYNREDTIQKVLHELYLQNEILKDNNVEILIIDDGSTDRTGEIVKGFSKKFTIKFNYYFQSNKGSASARNLGIKKSKGKILLFLDSDVIPSKNLVFEHLKFHGKYTHNNFALRGSVKTSEEQTASYSIREYADVEKTGKNRINGEYIELCWADLRTGNISIKKNILLENGIFDEEMPVLVDPELGFRLCKKGLKLFHSNKAIGYHLHAINLEQHFLYGEKYGKAAAIWYSKMPELKEELFKKGIAKNFGFFTWKEPLNMIKHLLSIYFVSKFTVKLLVTLGNITKNKHEKISHIFYYQVSKYYHRKAFNEQMILHKREYVKKDIYKRLLELWLNESNKSEKK